jgi:hypothetical protein
VWRRPWQWIESIQRRKHEPYMGLWMTFSVHGRQKKNWLLHQDKAQIFIYQKQHNCGPRLPYSPYLYSCDLSLLPAILTHLRCSRQNRWWCWTPSQNTPSRMHFKNGRSAGNGAYAREETTSKVMVASRSKVSFWPDESTSPENYGYPSNIL